MERGCRSDSRFGLKHGRRIDRRCIVERRLLSDCSSNLERGCQSNIPTNLESGCGSDLIFIFRSRVPKRQPFQLGTGTAQRNAKSKNMAPSLKGIEADIRQFGAGDAETISPSRRIVVADNPISIGLSYDEELTCPIEGFGNQLSFLDQTLHLVHSSMASRLGAKRAPGQANNHLPCTRRSCGEFFLIECL